MSDNAREAMQHYHSRGCAQLDRRAAEDAERMHWKRLGIPAPCGGFPDGCPNIRTVPPNRQHGGGVRCGCGEQDPTSTPLYPSLGD